MSKIVERTLDCFELFADQKRPLSMTEVSRLLGIAPSSCHDILQALQQRGYLYELARRGGFYPTQRLFNIARVIAQNDPVLMRAEILLRSLRDLLDESVLLVKVHEMQGTYLLSFEPSHPLRMSITVGSTLRSLYATSAGKALLASLDERDLDSVLRTLDLAPITKKTVETKAALRVQIDEGRRRGWFVNCEESVEGVMTLSAPFRWNRSLYIVTVAGPTARIEPRLALAAELLVDVCKRLEM